MSVATKLKLVEVNLLYTDESKTKINIMIVVGRGARVCMSVRARPSSIVVVSTECFRARVSVKSLQRKHTINYK